MSARAWNALRLVSSRRFIPQLLLALVLGAWLWLGLGPFAVGPSEWDDHYYTELAVQPSARWDALNRYAHVWLLRVAFLLFGNEGLSLEPLLAVLAASAGAFVLGRALAGSGAGLAAAALLPLYPALLRYLDAPFADTTMGAASMLALVSAYLASASVSERRRALYVALAGACCFVSVKSKETGLAVLPAVAFLLLARSARPETTRRATVFGWVLGLLGAWFLLACADAAFIDDFAQSLRPSAYLRRLPPVPKHVVASAEPSLGTNFVSLLTSGPFVGYTVLGLAGALLGSHVTTPKPSRSVAQALVIWAVAALLFSSLVAARFTGISALPRYAVVPGMPLVVLAVHYGVGAWRRAAGATELRSAELGSARSAAELAFLVAAGAAAAYALSSPSLFGVRVAHHLVPAILVVLAGAAHFGGHTRTRRGAVALCAVLLVSTSLTDGLELQRDRRARVEPWDVAALRIAGAAPPERAMARDGVDPVTTVHVSVYGLRKPYNHIRVRRRIVARRPDLAERLDVHKVSQAGDVRRTDWVVTRPNHSTSFTEHGWRVVAEGAEELRRHGEDFVVLAPPDVR